MASILDSVDQRTQLVGENRLELLMFRLGTQQLFAINVFKVREVVKVPPLTRLPGSRPNVSGIAHIRGVSVPVIDLRTSIGMRPANDLRERNLIITEYNRSIQGFLVGQVDNIVNVSWTHIQPPPSSTGRSNYLTAIAKIEDKGVANLVEIIDVEKVLAEIVTYDVSISQGVLDDALVPLMSGTKVLVVDDSATAHSQVKATLSQLGIEVISCSNGQEALSLLQAWCDAGKCVTDEILLMITDAEMPEMDGYRLTKEVRSDARMANLFITLNTSLTGSFNDEMVKKVGCDLLISKFQPDLLVQAVQERLRRGK
ncbi:chemotaxis protein CheV [Aeromonas simiae]|uniref:chemotaxis protein CheV n=3 Tax=Aeromonas simiae TaxID=218936 RepID=UPI0005A9D0E5|nr:chemotaxis protein CheV [Aeromonas simiae]